MRRDAYAEQVTAMTQSLYYIACSLLPVMADREDALQNCIVKGLTKCETLRDEAKFRPWITRILINECYALLRQKKRMVLAETIPAAPAEDVDVALHDAVRSLPDKKRIPFTLHLEGYTIAEIARILHVPEGTVKTRIRSAKLTLRAELSEGEEVLA